jgi:hypothetical protein
VALLQEQKLGLQKEWRQKEAEFSKEAQLLKQQKGFLEMKIVEHEERE